MKKRKGKNAHRSTQSSGRNLLFTVVDKQGNVHLIESFHAFMMFVQYQQDLNVKLIVSEGYTVFFVDEELKRRKTTLDFMVEFFIGKIELCEVTMSFRRDRLPIIRRERAVQEHCLEKGMIFRLETEKTLPDSTVWANMQAFYCFKDPGSYIQEIDCAVQAIFKQHEKMKVVDLISFVVDKLGCLPGDVAKVICYLLWNQVLQIDMNVLLIRGIDLNPKSEIWLPVNSNEREKV